MAERTEAVGAYREPGTKKSSSALGWIIGLIVLAALVLLALWAFGAFGGDEEEYDPVENQAVEPIVLPAPDIQRSFDREPLYLKL